MRHLLNRQVLDALRDSLRDLENLKLVSANESDVLLLREDLRKKIIEIENTDADENARQMTA